MLTGRTVAKPTRVFGGEHHREASPGPQDSFYLFEKLEGMLGAANV